MQFAEKQTRSVPGLLKVTVQGKLVAMAEPGFTARHSDSRFWVLTTAQSLLGFRVFFVGFAGNARYSLQFGTSEFPLSN